MSTEKKTQKPRRIDKHTAYWEKLANKEARKHCPLILACRDCGGPRVIGYCCNRCGSVSP